MLPDAARFTDLSRLSWSIRLGNYQSEMLGWGFFEPTWWRNYLHVHSFFEVCYAYAGRGLFRINEKDHVVNAGEVFVAKPGEPHEIISSEDHPLGIYFWSYTLTPALDSYTESLPEDDLVKAFFTSARPASSFPGLQTVLSLLTEEIMLMRPGYQAVIRALLVKLLLDAARAVVDLPAAPALESPVSLAEQTAQKIARYLQDNYNRRVLLRDVAAQIHLSQRHTSRLFQDVMGMTILDYLTQLRLEIAAQRLLDRSLSVKAVALSSGFPDVHYFTALFRRHTGMTPSTFRQRGGTHFLP